MSADDDATRASRAEPAGPVEPPGAGEPMPPAVRWLARLAVVAIGLRFIVVGFRDRWAAADGVATALVYAAVLLGVASAGLAAGHFARRRRQD